MLLGCLDPGRAPLADVAAGVHLRLRLGGACWPPTLRWRLYTHHGKARRSPACHFFTSLRSPRVSACIRTKQQMNCQPGHACCTLCACFFGLPCRITEYVKQLSMLSVSPA